MNDSLIERSFGAGWSQSMLEPIDQYGCWCYFQEDHGKGRGIPVNEIDEKCKILHNGYTCILMDAELAGDDDCVPWDIPYQSGSGLGLAADEPDNDSMEAALRTEYKRANRRSD